MKAHIRQIVILLLAVCILCICGCSEQKQDENETMQANMPLTGSFLGASNPYGHLITENGLQMYVNQDGISTVNIVSGGYTFVKTEYMLDTSSSAICSCLIGLDSTVSEFDDGTVLRIQPITKAADGQAYQECFDMIDENILNRHLQESVIFYRVWIEKPDGTKIERFDSPLRLLFEKGDNGYTEAVGINKGGDELLEQNDLSLNTSPVGEGRFLCTQIRHTGNIIALFTE